MAKTKKQGAPKKAGILVRVPCRFSTLDQYRRVIAQLNIVQRATILSDAVNPSVKTN